MPCPRPETQVWLSLGTNFNQISDGPIAPPQGSTLESLIWGDSEFEKQNKTKEQQKTDFFHPAE